MEASIKVFLTDKIADSDFSRGDRSTIRHRFRYNFPSFLGWYERGWLGVYLEFQDQLVGRLARREKCCSAPKTPYRQPYIMIVER